MKKQFFVIGLMIFILSACSILSTPTSFPTNTPVPTSTETPIPPTATSTPEPSPTPDPILFRDDFEGSLKDGWQWIRENQKYWSLTNNPGWLEIMARSGSVSDGNVNNLLLYPAPEGNFELETRLNFKPTGNFQIAGLLIYESADQHIQFGRAFCNAPQCAGDGFYLDLITGGNFSSENFATRAPEVDTVYLRLRREGSTFTGYVSIDGKQWNLIGAHKIALQPLFVGLVAGQAVGSVPKPAQFDYFIITRLP